MTKLSSEIHFAWKFEHNGIYWTTVELRKECMQAFIENMLGTMIIVLVCQFSEYQVQNTNKNLKLKFHVSKLPLEQIFVICLLKKQI